MDNLNTPSRLLYASSEIVYFSTKEVSSNHPPADKDVGSLSIIWMRYLQENTPFLVISWTLSEEG